MIFVLGLLHLDDRDEVGCAQRLHFLLHMYSTRLRLTSCLLLLAVVAAVTAVVWPLLFVGFLSAAANRGRQLCDALLQRSIGILLIAAVFFILALEAVLRETALARRRRRAQSAPALILCVCVFVVGAQREPVLVLVLVSR